MKKDDRELFINPSIEKASMPTDASRDTCKFSYNKSETFIKIGVMLLTLSLAALIMWLFGSVLPVSQLSSNGYFRQIILLKTLAITVLFFTIALALITILIICRRRKNFHFNTKKYIVSSVITLVLISLIILSIVLITKKENDFYREFYVRKGSPLSGYEMYEEYFPYLSEFFETDETVYSASGIIYEECSIIGNRYIYLSNDGSAHSETLVYTAEFVDSPFVKMYPRESTTIKMADNEISYVIIHDNYYGMNSITVFIWLETKSCRFTYGGEGTKYKEHQKSDEEILNDALSVFEKCS